jgi:large subunit ribosomal protein L18
MDKQKEKKRKRTIRHRRVRKDVSGSGDRPRLSVYKSLKNTYCQLIDDAEGRTLLAMSTLSKELKGAGGYGGNVKASAALGEAVAKAAVAKGIKKVAFDRGGFKYHGRIKALADAARKAGLEF